MVLDAKLNFVGERKNIPGIDEGPKAKFFRTIAPAKDKMVDYIPNCWKESGNVR